MLGLNKQEIQSPQAILLNELEARRKRNAKYSLRAFARDLEISHAFLSRFLNGKKGLSADIAHRIADLLAWSPLKRRAFVLALEASSATVSSRKDSARQELRALAEGPDSYARLLKDQYFALRHWCYGAIFELIAQDPAPNSIGEIARRLGISAIEAGVAVERLEHFGVISRKNGKFVRAHANLSTGDVPSPVIRGYHKQILDLAKVAVDEQEPPTRDFLTTTISIKKSDVPKAREMVRRFLGEVVAKCSGEGGDAVYQFSTQLFRIDREDTH